MDTNENGVRFVRIRGRIVPIRPKKPKQSNDVLNGTKLMVAGSLVTLAGAEAAGRAGMFGKRQAHGTRLFTAKAAAQVGKGVDAHMNLVRAAKFLKRSKTSFAFAKAGSIGAAIVGGGLLAEGLVRAAIPKQYRDSPGLSGVAHTVTGIPALAAVNYIVKKRAFPFLK